MTLFTFLIFNVVGGDPALALAGKYATPEQVDTIREQLGLNKSLLIQYVDFIKQTLTFDWGVSWQTQESINQMILRAAGPSLSLTLPTLIFSFLISLAIALFSASSRGKYQVADKIVTTFCLTLMSISFLVYIIVFQYFFAFKLGWFELNGWEDSWTGRWPYLVLPWIISVVVSLGPNILIFRSAIIDEVNNDYVRTAQAKGIDRVTLFSQHVLKNAMIPILTIVMLQIPFLIMGSVLLETFFGIPGLGGLLIQAIQNADFPMVKAFTVIGSILFLVINLVTDLFYTWIDPRVKLQ